MYQTMQPITLQPTNEIGFGGENKTEGHVNGKKLFRQFAIRVNKFNLDYFNNTSQKRMCHL